MTGSASKCVLILGMHRSGTSCLAGSLQQHGVHLGKVFEQNPHNKKGNRENADIMKLNDDLLAANGGSWDRPPAIILWNEEHEKTRDTIIQEFVNSGNQIWGFKDPRNLITLEFWMDGLSNTDVRLVGSYRHPLLAAKSLNARNNMPMENGMWLWEIYNNKLMELYSKSNFPILSFDVDVEEYQRAIHRVLDYLAIPSAKTTQELFFDESLRHAEVARSAHSEEMSRTTKALYHQLNEIYEGQKI
jgi:hypothetical protein